MATLRRPFAIVGYIPYFGARGKVGSLLLGLYDEQGAYRFAGCIHKGLVKTMRVELATALESAHTPVPSVVDAPWLGDLERWSLPRLVAEVEFTRRGRFWTPSFRGLRSDKTPNECVRASPATGDDIDIPNAVGVS